MGRPVYPFELVDPDFAWLLTTFQESRPEYFTIQDVALPVVMISSQPMVADRDSLPPAAHLPESPFQAGPEGKASKA